MNGGGETLLYVFFHRLEHKLQIKKGMPNNETNPCLFYGSRQGEPFLFLVHVLFCFNFLQVHRERDIHNIIHTLT